MDFLHSIDSYHSINQPVLSVAPGSLLGVPNLMPYILCCLQIEGLFITMPMPFLGLSVQSWHGLAMKSFVNDFLVS